MTQAAADGAFKLDGVAVGQVNVTASLMSTDTPPTYQAGTTAAPVEVKENAETKIADPIKMVTATAPARGGRGGGAGGGGGGGGAGGGRRGGGAGGPPPAGN
jgi:hypothetical protein